MVSVELLVSILRTLGVPVILVLFYLDGMVIGKVTPPAALYITYVAAFSPTAGMLAAVGLGSVVASTLGQVTIYRGFNEESPEFLGIRRRIPHVRRIPFVVKDRVGDSRMALVTRLFERFGGIGLTVTNVVPGIRSLMAIPAGLSRYPVRRFVLFSVVGNVGYIVLLTAVAWELVDLASVLRGVVTG